MKKKTANEVRISDWSSDVCSSDLQSLSRVLSHLVDEAYIVQRPGDRDRRQRLLTLTPKGVELESRLTANQRERIATAFRNAGAEAVQGFKQVLQDRKSVV